MCKTLTYSLSDFGLKKRVMKLLKAMIFDVDGTLAETERDGHREAFNRAFFNHDLDWYWDEELYGHLLAVPGGKERIRFYLKQVHPNRLQQHDTETFIAQLHREKTKHYVELLNTGAIVLRPGVRRLLAEIRDSEVRLAIATTTAYENVEALLVNQLGEDSLGWFECIAAGDVAANKKPAADIFHYCLDELKLTADACLAVEDSQHGLHAAHSAGLSTIVTCNDYTKQEDFGAAKAVFNHLGDPGQPCTQLAGLPNAADFVTLADLQSLHAHDNQ